MQSHCVSVYDRNPENTDNIFLLANVLYRQGKISEATQKMEETNQKFKVILSSNVLSNLNLKGNLYFIS